MTLEAGALDSAAASSDPFGLWILPPAASAASALTFGIEAGARIGATGDGGANAPAAVWLLALGTTAGGAAPVLAQRARRVEAVAQGLASAPARLERALALDAGGQFSSAPPERLLAGALANSSAVPSFGLFTPDWGALSARCAAMFDSVNRQVLHYAWVDTTLDGRLAARTVVGWDGDLSACMQTGLPAALIATHQRSFELAMLARAASMRAAVTTIQLAARIGLLAASPLAPAHALALAWQFLETIISE